MRNNSYNSCTTVKRLRDFLTKGHPEYGCSVNMSKSLTNFDITISGQKVPRLQGSRWFPFCGNAIDIETLDIVKDVTRMEGSCMLLYYLIDTSHY
jgi:hypothetical protein